MYPLSTFGPMAIYGSDFRAVGGMADANNGRWGYEDTAFLHKVSCLVGGGGVERRFVHRKRDGREWGRLGGGLFPFLAYTVHRCIIPYTITCLTPPPCLPHPTLQYLALVCFSFLFLALPYLALPSPVLPYPAPPFPAPTLPHHLHLSCPTRTPCLSYSIPYALPYPALFHLSYLTLPDLALPCPTIPDTTLVPYPTLPYLVLPCFTYPTLHHLPSRYPALPDHTLPWPSLSYPPPTLPHHPLTLSCPTRTPRPSYPHLPRLALTFPRLR